MYMIFFNKYGLRFGRSIGGKERFSELKKNNILIYNAVVSSKDGVVWTGDLDLTEDKAKIDYIAKIVNQELIVEDELFKTVYSTKTGLSGKYKKYEELYNSFEKLTDEAIRKLNNNRYPTILQEDMKVNKDGIITISIRVSFDEIIELSNDDRFASLFEPSDFVLYLKNNNSVFIEGELYYYLLYENEDDVDIDTDMNTKSIPSFEDSFNQSRPEILIETDCICYTFTTLKQTTMEIRDFILTNFSLLKIKKLNKETFEGFLPEVKTHILDEINEFIDDYFTQALNTKRKIDNKKKSEFYDW